MKKANRSPTSHPQAFSHRSQNSFLVPQGELELFHYMIDHIGDEVMVVRADGRIVFANRAAVKKFGYPPGALLNKSITDLFRNKITLAQWKKKYWLPLKKARHPVSYVIDRVGKGGKAHTVDITAVYMHYKSEEYVLSVARDITDQLALQQKLKESEKMKALQNVIAGTVREIQHPLKGILDHSHALVEKYQDCYFEYIGYKEFKDIMQTLAAMRDQVKSCFETTNQLLDINRRKVHLKGTHCNAHEVIRAAIKGLQHSLEAADVRVRLRLAGRLSPKGDLRPAGGAGLPPVAIGALELSQVMTNVLINAMQAIPGGGEVEVRTCYQKADRKVRIECRDEGVGIAEEDLSRIFEPFFTTKNRGPGKSSGLGLTVAYSLIKSFQGEIVVKSKLRQGTLVQMTFPVYKNKHYRSR